MERKLILPCSSEQEQYIIDHLQTGNELVIHHAERVWIANHVFKQEKRASIKSADLDIETGKWTVIFVTPNN